MFESFWEFFTAVKQADFGFYELWEFFVNLYYSISKVPEMVDIWSGFRGSIDPFFGAVPYILIVLALVVAFFGKKIMPVLKFIGCAFVGFFVGLYFIHPLITELIAIPAWVTGIVISIIAAVLYRFLYVGAYAIGLGYCAYILFYSGFYLRGENVEHTVAKAVVCLAIAVGVVVVAFIFRKYIEMAGTAILGGYLVSYIIRCMIYDYKALDFLQATPWAAAAVITLVIAIPAFIVQYKTRKQFD